MSERYRDRILSLPPIEDRIHDPQNNPDHKKLDTPLDQHGLVDIPLLIKQVKATIRHDYEWPYQLSRHHFYWPESDYDIGTERNFRDLTPNKGLVLRQFENWLHVVTKPPPKPTREVMEKQIEAWTAAKGLFRMARRTVQYKKMIQRREQLIRNNPDIVSEGFNGQDIIGEACMAKEFDRIFFGFNLHTLMNEDVPPEHRLVETGSPPEEVAKHLGKLVAPNSSYLVRTIRAAA